MSLQVPDFRVDHSLEALALQPDWGVRNEQGSAGGRWVVSDRQRARAACTRFLACLRSSQAQVALVPELAIPREQIVEIVESIRSRSGSTLFLGGIEGQSPAEYLSSLEQWGGHVQPLSNVVTETYVNAMLVVIKTDAGLQVLTRAKRIPSGAENSSGPLMARGAGPFFELLLGPRPIRIVPLICSEFVWADQLGHLIEAEVSGAVDVMPVLQLNDDPTYGHLGPQLHQSFARTKTQQTRFIFANQAAQEHCDGSSAVIVPPSSPNAPAFDIARPEVWSLPGGIQFKGFHIADITGCIWQVTLSTQSAPTTALKTPICSGSVLEVLSPPTAPLRSLAIGLLRSAAHTTHRRCAQFPQASARDAALQTLKSHRPEFLLRQVTSETATGALSLLQNSLPIQWSSVMSIANDAIEALSLLATGSDAVKVDSTDKSNCVVSGRPVLVLYAPNVDESIGRMLQRWDAFDGTEPPAAIIMIGVHVSSANPEAKRLGDVSQADSISSPSSLLVDAPQRTEGLALSVRWKEIDFRTVVSLRANWALSVEAARLRLVQMMPRVYA